MDGVHCNRGAVSRRNIKLPEEEYVYHNRRRKEMGLTWSQYIDGQAPDMEAMIRRVIRDELDADA